jgi:ubiquinone/menaquinone biosynthesis C-methylase UbiE
MAETPNLKADEWNESYRNRDNFVFYPHEEIIRFFARYISKRIGINQYQVRHSLTDTAKVLDVGCGIGRHLVFAAKTGVDIYGIDLSSQAIATAKDWLIQEGISLGKQQLVQGSITVMPWQDNYFDFAFSHGVFDSMYVEIAREGIVELARVMKPNALFYCDLIFGDAGDVLVETQHELGTVQSYYTQARIDQLIAGCFSIKEMVLIQREDILSGQIGSRWHLILERLPI